MLVYVAGPMRGVPKFNFPAFMATTEQLEALGHEVYNPAQRDIDTGFDPAGLTGNENLNDGEHRFDLRDALGADLDWITSQADALCLLPGWAKSKGARAELATAVALDLRAGMIEDFIGGTVRPAAEFIAKAATQTSVSRNDEVRVTSSTGGQKGQKLAQMSALDPQSIQMIAEVAGFGAGKYSKLNFMKGYDSSLSYDALQRHLHGFWNGEDRDPESGLPHLAHAGWHCMALLSFFSRRLGADDRYPTLSLAGAL